MQKTKLDASVPVVGVPGPAQEVRPPWWIQPSAIALAISSGRPS